MPVNGLLHKKNQRDLECQLSLDYMLKGDVNLMKKIKKDTNDLKKYQNIKEILKIICYGLLIIAFFYLAGHAIGKGWAYYTQ